MSACAVADILYLYKLARDVNKKLEQQGQPPLAIEDYGRGFVQRLFSEHERLFPQSSERICWIIGTFMCIFIFLILEVL